MSNTFVELVIGENVIKKTLFELLADIVPEEPRLGEELTLHVYEGGKYVTSVSDVFEMPEKEADTAIKEKADNTPGLPDCDFCAHQGKPYRAGRCQFCEQHSEFEHKLIPL